MVENNKTRRSRPSVSSFDEEPPSRAQSRTVLYTVRVYSNKRQEQDWFGAKMFVFLFTLDFRAGEIGARIGRRGYFL